MDGELYIQLHVGMKTHVDLREKDSERERERERERFECKKENTSGKCCLLPSLICVGLASFLVFLPQLYFFLLLIHMSFICVYVMSCVCLARRSAIFHGKNFNIGRCLQTAQPNFYLPCL